MLVTMKEILDKAKAGNYGVTAPNVANEDTVRAAIEAAEENNAPMIIDVAFSMTPDIVFLGRMIEDLARRSTAPICFNLDHGKTYEQVIWALRAGFTSVMVDRSTLPFAENVAEVKELTKAAHAVGVSVESELGHVGEGDHYAEHRDAALTDPKEAKDFIDQTGIDCLAIAIGTAHGPYIGEPYLDFDRLAEIKNVVDVPLVLHGGSGTGDDNLARACREGINKVNLATDLAVAGKEAIAKNIGTQNYNGFNAYDDVKTGYKDKLVHYMKLFNQCGKA